MVPERELIPKPLIMMLQITPTSASTVYHARAYVTVGGTTTYGDVKDVKLSDLQSGIWMVANPGSDIDDKIAALTMIPASCATWKKMLWSTTQARC